MTIMQRRPLLRLPLLLAAVTAAFAGCTEEFDPYNRLTGFRVLAIRSEPPLPGPGETSTLSVLVYAPADDPPVSYAWSWCPMAGPAEKGHECLVGEEQLAMLAAAGLGLPPLDLGAAPTASLTHAVDPGLLAALCDGSTGLLPTLPDCERGFPVQIKVTVSSGTRTATAVRELRLRFDPATEPNRNPTIEGLEARQEEDLFVPMTEQNALTLPRDDKTDIRAIVPDAASETYMGKDNDLRPAIVREQLVLTWFIESGDTKSERTTYIPGDIPLKTLVTNEWTPARIKDYARDRARIIAVLRDNRGGVAWTEGAVTLGAEK
jgi:hypothetical protein